MATQTTLVEEQQTVETVVRKGYCLAKFVKPIPERDKDDNAFISFEVSFPLTEEHEKDGVLPAEIRDAWKAVVKHGLRVGTVMKVDSQDVRMRLAPDTDTGELAIDRAIVEKATISIVEETGSGEAKEVVRLQLRVKTDLDKESWAWAGRNFGHPIWIRLYQAQGNLLHR